MKVELALGCPVLALLGAIGLLVPQLPAQDLLLDSPALQQIAQSDSSNFQVVRDEDLSALSLTDATGEDPAAERIQQRFPNGSIQLERWVVQSPQGDWINHGRYVEYNAEGEPIVEGRYEHGQPIGDWSQQITLQQAQKLTQSPAAGFQAPLVSKATFVDGQLHGDWTCVDAAGNLLFVWKLAGGIREGHSLVLQSDGEPILSLMYVNNRVHGAAQVRHGTAPGQLEDVEFDQGRRLRRLERYFPSSGQEQRVLQSQAWYLVPTGFNVEAHYWRESRVEYASANRDQPIQHGAATTYFENGRPAIEGNFVYGERDGKFTWWYSNGQQQTVGSYSKGKQQGAWTWWHQNGMKEAVIDYAFGQQLARSVWSPAGKLVSRTAPSSTPDTGSPKFRTATHPSPTGNLK